MCQNPLYPIEHTTCKWKCANVFRLRIFYSQEYSSSIILVRNNKNLMKEWGANHWSVQFAIFCAKKISLFCCKKQQKRRKNLHWIFEILQILILPIFLLFLTKNKHKFLVRKFVWNLCFSSRINIQNRIISNS